MALECSICMDPLDDFLSVLKCGHKFHSKCIIEYGYTHNNKELTCPLCRDIILDPRPNTGSVVILVNPEQRQQSPTRISDTTRFVCAKMGISSFVCLCIVVGFIFLNPGGSS